MKGETMSKRGLSALRDALTASPGPHVDDETLAMIVTAEAAGEEVEEAFAAPLAHIERCATCAASYDELAQMMFAAVADMGAAADAVAPQDAYAALLAQRLEREGWDAAQAESLAAAAAHKLPLVFTAAPGPEDVDEALLEAALGSTTIDYKPTVPALVQAVRDTTSALALYLRGLAEETWARRVSFRDTITQGWNRLQVAPGVAGAAGPAILHERGPGYEHAGQTPSLIVEARAERLDALTCRLIVHVKGSEDPQATRRVVRLKAGPQRWQATTGEDCTVQFEPLPIASLPELMIEVGGP